MKTRIVRHGNSYGIRIPKTLLELAGLQGEVELTADVGLLLIRPVCRPRADWAEKFKEMHRCGDDLRDLFAP